MIHQIFRIALTVFCSSLFLRAQEDVAPPAPVQTIVTVEARHGKDVPTLRQGDVVVLQKSERLPVTSLIPAQAPLELYILIDDACDTSLATQFNDLRQFIDNQPASTFIGLAYMRNGTAAIEASLTTDHAKVAKAVRLPLGLAGVSPSPYLSLSDLIKKWPAGSARREVLLIGSGVDPLGGEVIDPYLDTAVEQAQRASIVVYAIYAPAGGHAGHSYWQLNWGQSHLAQITEQTGGESYMLGFGPLVSFAPYLAEISQRLANQYLLTFQAKRENKAGLQSIRLTTEVPNADLVYAGKVYVPAASH